MTDVEIEIATALDRVQARRPAIGEGSTDPALLAAGAVRGRPGRRGLPQHVEQADLVSYGIFGLIDAIEKFDPDRGFKFETYAIARIKGAILDELRSHRLGAPVGAGQGPGHREAPPALEASCTGRPPTPSWPRLDMTDDQLQRTLTQISLVGLVTFDEALGRRGRGEAPAHPRRHPRRPAPAPGHAVELGETPPGPRRRHRPAARARERRRERSTTTTASPWPRSARSSA